MEKKKVLGREDLLKKQELKVESVELDEKSAVHVRQMTGREREQFEKSLRHEIKKGNDIKYEHALDDFRAKLAVCTVCDEKGVLIFQAGDYKTLSQNISAAWLDKIATVASKLNAITEEDKEDLVKNSEAAQGGDSDSNSAED